MVYNKTLFKLKHFPFVFVACVRVFKTFMPAARGIAEKENIKFYLAVTHFNIFIFNIN